MQLQDFETLSQIVKRQSGLVLTPDKGYLLESRLLPVARKWNLASVAQLAEACRLRPNAQQVADITEAMTTNESFFFRDNKPFDMLREVMLPALLKAREQRRRLRIWSAAASSGQEAYSIAMLLKEKAAELAGWNMEIVGTDLSGEMIDRAKSGIYTAFEAQRGMPARLLVKYFARVGDKWQISEELRRMVSYRCWNLLHDLGGLGQFDIVFCRNVLIYFDLPTKTSVLAAIAKLMPPDGYLVLGAAETVLGVTDRFKAVAGQPGLYMPVPPSEQARKTA